MSDTKAVNASRRPNIRFDLRRTYMNRVTFNIITVAIWYCKQICTDHMII